jgi:hypothetical protein
MTRPPRARRPVWSDALTRPLAAVIPIRWRLAAGRLIKGFHTVAFVVIGGSILVYTWDGATRRTGRRAGVAAAVAIAETIVYASNNQVCPLTPLAENLGAESGSVTDIYLPRWISNRIPMVGGSTLILGLVLHAVAWRQRPRSLVP